MISTDKLKNMVYKKALGNNELSSQLYQMFFFEQILERISKSKYKENIILKGGLLLSSIIGENMRTTRDMDATLKSIPLDKEKIKLIMNEILNINVDDNIIFTIIDIKDIRLEDTYGGFRINVLGVFEQLKVNMFIEFTTGDVITPREIDYDYNCLFKDSCINILAYTKETIIAEKFETVISRNVSNTRLKDFYDLFILLSGNYDTENLYIAIKNTFRKRNTEFNISEFNKTLSLINDNNNILKNWVKYQEKYPFARNILFIDIINKLFELIKILGEKDI